MSRDLARASVRGAAWSISAGYSGFVISLVVNLLLARLLYPDEFGAFVMALAIIDLVGILGAFSVPTALIYFEDSEPHLFDTGTWLNLATAGIVVLVAVASVGLFVRGGPGSELGQFVLVLALARALQLMAYVPGAAIEKRFWYRSYSGLLFLAGLAGNALVLALAWYGFGAISLVGREVLTGLAMWVLFSAASPHRFRGRFSRATAGKIVAYCWRFFVSRGLQIVFDRADRLMVGVMTGDRTLGIYDRSRYICEMGMTLARPVDGISFNLYARLREERERLVRAWTLINYFLVRVMAGLALVLLIYPREVVLIFLGPRWLESAETLRWMAVYAGLLPIHQNMTQLLYGRGLIREVNLVKALQIAVFVPLLGLWLNVMGPVSVGIVLLAALLAGLALMFRYQRALIGHSFRELFVTPAIAFGIAAVGLAALAPLLPERHSLPGAVAMVLAGAGVYAAILVLAERRRMLVQFRLVLAQFSGGQARPEAES